MEFGWAYVKKFIKKAYSIKLHHSLMIGDGGKVNFWEDTWCNKEPFSELFHILYVLPGSKGASAKEAWRPVGKEGGVGSSIQKTF